MEVKVREKLCVRKSHFSLPPLPSCTGAFPFDVSKSESEGFIYLDKYFSILPSRAWNNFKQDVPRTSNNQLSIRKRTFEP